MSKPFQTHRQQLRILRNRNLKIADGSKAIRILKREGYYNIINGYKEIFLDTTRTEQQGHDHYKEDITFEQIYLLYDFDRNIRTALLKYLLKMETSIKTRISYYFSEKHKNHFSYFDINNFDNTSPQEITKLIANLSQIITNNNKNRDQGGQFYHYLTKHKELPMWVLIKKLSLGQVSHLYLSLTKDIKEKIMLEILTEYNKAYNTTISFDFEKQKYSFDEALFFLTQFRNICAHEERLYNSVIKKDRSRKIPKIEIFHTSKKHIFNSKLFDCIIILGFFISKKDYLKLTCSINEELKILESKLPGNIYNQILINMGFPKMWESELRLP